jgi:DNA repair protein SbcC/Rad50
MKIVSICGENIASLGAFAIDFEKEPLHSAGIYAIVGPTGAGKSSLLDALCLALYHDIPRLHGQGVNNVYFTSALGQANLSSVDHIIRRGCTTAFARVVFRATDGNVYESHWGYRQGKRAGSKSQLEVYVKHAHTHQILAQQARQVQDMVRNLIGLDFSQFSRTVLLAQGDFAAFLKSNDIGERTQILEQITGMQLYTQVGMAIGEKYKESKQQIEVLNQRLDALVSLSAEQIEELQNTMAKAKKELAALDVLVPWAQSLQTVTTACIEKQNAIERILPKLHTISQLVQLHSEQLAQSQQVLEELEKNWQSVQPQVVQARTLDAQIQNDTKQLATVQLHCDTALNELQQARQAVQTNTNEYTRIVSTLQKTEQWLQQQHWLQAIYENWNWLQDGFLQYYNSLQAAQELQTIVHTMQESLAPIKTQLQQEQLEMEKRQLEMAQIPYTKLELRIQSLQKKVEQLTIQNHVSVVQKELAHLELQKEQLQGDLQRAAKRQEAASIAYTTGSSISDSVVESLRAKLQPQEACPVCGSTSHPFANQTTQALREQVQGLKVQFDQAAKEYSKALQSMSACEASIHNLQREVQKNTTALQSIAGADDDVNLDDYTTIEQVQEHLSQCNTWQQQQLQCNKQEQAFLKKQLQLQNKEQQLQSHKAEWQQKNNYVQEFETRVKRIPTLNWVYIQGELQKNGLEFCAQLQTQVPRFSKALECKIDLESQAQSLQQQEPLLQKNVKDCETRNQSLQQQLQDAKANIQNNTKQRQGLLQGQSTELFCEEYERNLQKARAQKELNQSQLQQATVQKQDYVSQQQLLQSDVQQLQDKVSELKEQAHTIQGGFVDDPALSQYGDLLHNLPWQSLATVSDMAYGHSAGFVARQKQAIQAQSQVESRLNANAEQQKQKQEWLQQVQKKRTDFAHLEQLYNLLGKNNGAYFRTIASQYTLKVLLEIANKILQQMTSRYSLAQHEDTMHFVVKDSHNYNAARPVHTLSGGESFIISLAMALALSELAGGGQAIESLFIDEGFGTLDEHTLRSVMKALYSLHSQGRKVGIITHVQEMKENIAVRIEVSPVSPGLSTIVIH